ncbi:hypothetical protein [Pseudonocardia acaciae]|uniref:hypothetical protein n=1 Tax=Pseudonocardia acaciae TaxID=551276 RepID=UPI00048F3FE8|nr:hypothetical protein [Pseudonocardia acaciae]
MSFPVRTASALAAALLGTVLTGCAGSSTPAPAPGAAPLPLPPAPESERLAGACPATIVVQNSWEPSADDASLYQLLGPGSTIDAEHKLVTGPLVAAGKDTGVRLEVRSGGGAIGFATVPARMYLDRSITLGGVHTDLAIATSANQPMTAVFAPQNKSPQILMWDPASHPEWRGIADIGASNAKVVVSKDSHFAPMLVSKGMIKPEQVEAGYTGAPARFVTDPTIAQQGYATNELYTYQHELPSWKKPVKYQLLADVGYPVYPEPLSVRAADLGPLSGCLAKLVPILQRAQLDYLTNPGPTNQLMVDAVARFNTGWTFSLGVAQHAATVMKDLRLAANDPSTGALGGMDPARVQAAIDLLSPSLKSSGANVKPNLKAEDIATNRFINPAVKLN